MATDNVSFKDAIFILNNNIVNKSVSFSDTVSKTKHNIVKELSSTSINVSDEMFPKLSLPQTHFKRKDNSKYLQKKNNSNTSNRNIVPVLEKTEYSSPNGTFLKYMSNNSYANQDEVSWVSSLADQLSHKLINSPSSLSSHSSLNKLIESHVINFLSSIPNGTQEQ